MFKLFKKKEKPFARILTKEESRAHLQKKHEGKTLFFRGEDTGIKLIVGQGSARDVALIDTLGKPFWINLRYYSEMHGVNMKKEFQEYFDNYFGVSEEFKNRPFES